jgi:hypothetical protein
MYQDQNNAVASESQEQYSNTYTKDRLDRSDKWMLLMAIQSDHHLHREAVVVAAAIIERINLKAGHDYAFASYETYADDCRRSRRTVVDAVNALVERGWFTRVKRKHQSCRLHARFDRQNERLAPPAEKPKGKRKAAKAASSAAPVQGAPSPAAKPKQRPVVVAVNRPAPISEDAVKLTALKATLKHIKPTKQAIRSWEIEYTNIAHELDIHLLELDDEVGKQFKHLQMKFIRAELSKRNRQANMVAKAA